MKSVFCKRIGVMLLLIDILLVISVVGWMRLNQETEQTIQNTGVSVPVIMYHHILKDESRHGAYVISPQEFEEDLQFLKENGYTSIRVEDLLNYVQRGISLPEKPILLTFDDAYRSFYAYAFPLLEQYEEYAVVAVIGEYTDLYSEMPDSNLYYSHINWQEIGIMWESGWVEFENHSSTLHKRVSDSPKRMGVQRLPGESMVQYRERLSADILPLQQSLTDITGETPKVFVYPFGAKSEGAEDIIRELGFEAAFDCEEKMNCFMVGEEDALMNIHRYNRKSGLSIREILQKCNP